MRPKQTQAIDNFKAALEEIERGIRILSSQIRPDQGRIDSWRVIAFELRQKIVQEKKLARHISRVRVFPGRRSLVNEVTTHRKHKK